MGHILVSLAQFTVFAWQEAFRVTNAQNPVRYEQRKEDVQFLLVLYVNVHIPQAWDRVLVSDVDDAGAWRDSHDDGSSHGGNTSSHDDDCGVWCARAVPNVNDSDARHRQGHLCWRLLRRDIQ